MIKFGLDFGTTNSSISVSFDGNNSQIIEVDKTSLNPKVVRSMLYFNHRELVYGPDVKPGQLETQNFSVGDIEYKGEQIYLIGQSAVDKYILENRNRKPGIKRKIFTGRWIKIQYGEGNSGDPMPEYYEEVDYGTGRLIQALKSSLRTFYKGTTIFGKYYTVEEMIGIFVKKFKDATEKETGEIVEEITVGRPVHFSDVETIDQKAQDRLAVAMKFAGFKKLKFQFEPVAAAKQFVSKTKGKKETIFVFDFGGGTLDTALIESGPLRQSESETREDFKVLATDGVYIGGDLLNADIMQAKLWNYFGASDSWGDQGLPVPLHIYQALNSWHSITSLNNLDNMELLKNIAYKH